jgi:hypothetical protein
MFGSYGIYLRIGLQGVTDSKKNQLARKERAAG